MVHGYFFAVVCHYFLNTHFGPKDFLKVILAWRRVNLVIGHMQVNFDLRICLKNRNQDSRVITNLDNLYNY